MHERESLLFVNRGYHSLNGSGLSKWFYWVVYLHGSTTVHSMHCVLSFAQINFYFVFSFCLYCLYFVCFILITEDINISCSCGFFCKYLKRHNNSCKKCMRKLCFILLHCITCSDKQRTRWSNYFQLHN